MLAVSIEQIIDGYILVCAALAALIVWPLVIYRRPRNPIAILLAVISASGLGAAAWATQSTQAHVIHLHAAVGATGLLLALLAVLGGRRP